MKRIAVHITLAVALAALAGAQAVDLTLQHANIDDLSPDARAAYEDAVHAYDRMDQIGAVNSMARAAELAPETMEIQLLFIDLVHNHVRFRNFSWREGVSLLEQCQMAYGRMLSQPELPDWAHTLLSSELDQLNLLVDNADQIYASRMQDSSEYLTQTAALRQRQAQLRQQQETRLRQERQNTELRRDPAAPNPLFQAATEARSGRTHQGVMSVRAATRGQATREGVTRVR
jgi:hypothetical protein